MPTCTELCGANRISSESSYRVFQTYSKSTIHQSALRIVIPKDRYSALFRASGEFEGIEISSFSTTKWFMPRLLSGRFFIPPPTKIISQTSPHNGNYFRHWLINTEWLDSLFCNADGCSLKFPPSQLLLQTAPRSLGWISIKRIKAHCLLNIR